MSRAWSGETCPTHRGTYTAGCPDCQAYQRSKWRASQTAARRRRAQTDHVGALNRQPASLTLEQYRRVDPVAVGLLVREFGTDGALRLLNGPRQRACVKPAPADPATIAPPGAVGIPRAHRSKARVEVIRGEA